MPMKSIPLLGQWVSELKYFALMYIVHFCCEQYFWMYNSNALRHLVLFLYHFLSLLYCNNPVILTDHFRLTFQLFLSSLCNCQYNNYYMFQLFCQTDLWFCCFIKTVLIICSLKEKMDLRYKWLHFLKCFLILSNY